MPGRLIILDRDGVINEDSNAFIKGPDEWLPIPGSLEAIARLNHNGFLPIVITNQSGIGRGLLSLADLNSIHAKMHYTLSRLGGSIEAILFCPHTPKENCACRKPKIRLFEHAALRFGQSLDGVFVVGDSLRDLEAARRVGAQGVLVRTGKGAHTLQTYPELSINYPVFADLATSVAAILSGD